MGQTVPAYGIVQSATPHMKMLRGWNPLNPGLNRNKSLPTNGLTIASGQVISVNIVSSAEVWQIGVSASTQIPFFAYQDSDDFDVVASGGLTGVSTQDQNELQTAFFNPSPTTVAYSNGVRLKADAVTPGLVTTALTTDRQTLGYLSRGTGPVDIAASNPGVTPDGSGQVLVLTIATDFQSNGATA